MKLRQIINENDNKGAAQSALQEYISLLSEFKPKKIQFSSGYERDSYYVDLKVPDQFESPALFIDFARAGAKPHNSFNQLPLNTVMINVWTKVDTPKYKNAILKLFQTIAAKFPKTPVVWNEDDLNGTVKKYSNLKELEKMF